MTHLAKVPSARPLSESEEIEGELRKEDLVWSEHEFNDGDQENRRVLRKFLGNSLGIWNGEMSWKGIGVIDVKSLKGYCHYVGSSLDSYPCLMCSMRLSSTSGYGVLLNRF